MAAASNAMSTVEADVEISPDGSAWTSFSTYATTVEVPEQARMTGTAYTFGNDLATVTQGKREPMEVMVRGLYSEGNSDPFEVVRAYFEAGTAVYMRYSPKGIGATGRHVFTTTNDGAAAAAVSISQFKYPDIDASTADPAPFHFGLMVPGFVKTETGNSTGLGS